MSDNWERGAEYLIGSWSVDASADLDEFAERLKALKRKKVVLAFRPGASTPRPGGATVLNFYEGRRRIADKPMNAEERVKAAYRKQRADIEDGVRANKIAKIQADIAALDAMDLPVEKEVRLDILRREFEAQARLPQDERRALHDKQRFLAHEREYGHRSDPELLDLYLEDPTCVETWDEPDFDE